MDRRLICAFPMLGCAVFLSSFGISAAAQVVQSCDSATQLDLIATPEDLNIRHFANGAVMVAIVDDGREDVGTALSVLILSPPLDAHGERQCRLARLRDGDGFAALLLDIAAAHYDPAIGLTVAIPGVGLLIPDSVGETVELSVTINQATGNVTAIHTEGPMN